MTNYFICSIGQPGSDYDDENLRRCMVNTCFVLHDANIQKGTIREIKQNDILILKYKGVLIGYGRATGGVTEDNNVAQGSGWKWAVKVNLWIIGNQTDKTGVKDAQESGTNYDTVKKVNKEYAFSKINEIGFPL